MNSSKIIKFGKYIGFVYPDIYFQFVSKLYREHPDIVNSMVLAKVRLEDGSARDFLNAIFETNVPNNIPMEEGYKIFYLALEKRRNNQIANREIQNTANEFAKPSPKGYRFRPEEEDGKPLFPSIEEMEDKGMK